MKLLANHHGKGASALVVTLSLLVLVTVAALAFFARATANRAIESARANQALAEQIGRTAEDYVIGTLLQEMALNASALMDQGITVYSVTNASGMVPARSVPPTTFGTNFANLRRRSFNESTNGIGETNASSHSTTAPSRNGRSIRLERWNAPQLNFGAGFNSPAQAPNWIYLNRDGSVSSSATTNAIGRFAYAIYETGGLLDAGLAGHPSLTGSELQRIKSTLSGADLSGVAGVTNAPGLAAWRNPGVSGSAFVTQVTNAASGGFLAFSPKTFTSRQDLIRLARSGAGGFNTNALPNLSHTARWASSPTTRPVTPAGSTIDYAAAADSPTAANRFFPNVRVKNEFTRRDGSTARPGAPLVTTRFALSRLAGLGSNGPTAGATDASIQRDFGLAWDSANRRWNYVGATGSAVQTGIQTLDEVADENREPNFFELLKAGILSGSVGKAAERKTLAGDGARVLEGDADLQIARIAACLVDQADSDNFPTDIHLGGVTMHGVENLPYLAAILPMERWRHDPWGQYPSDAAALTAARSGPTSFSISYGLIWVPKLWNPHAESLASPTATPRAIRVRIADGTLVRVRHSSIGGASGDTSPLEVTVPRNLPSGAIEIPAQHLELFRATSRPPDDSIATLGLPGQLNWWNPTPPWGDRYCGFVLNSVERANVTIQAGLASLTGFFTTVETSGAMIVLEYQDAAGNWRVYDTLAGAADLPTATGITTTSADDWAYGVSGFWGTANNAVSSAVQFAAKWDPRTPRWGPSHGWSIGPAAVANLDGNNGIRRNEPFNAAPSDDTAIPFGLWPQGREGWNTAGTFTLVPGADGVFRPNDASLGDAANPYRNMADSARRPVILQRPFRTVGEIGHAFRDTPWQSLNFYNSLSADSALLDLLSVEEMPSVTAGGINLNTARVEALEALLTGMGKATDGSSALSASAVAADLVDYRSSLPGGAFLNKSQLADFLSSSQFNSGDSSEVIKNRREATVRALSGISETSTWNVLIDAIAQAGRQLPGSTGADGFIVESEYRTWSSLAIDRHTGRILFRQTETVAE